MNFRRTVFRPQPELCAFFDALARAFGWPVAPMAHGEARVHMRLKVNP